MLLPRSERILASGIVFLQDSKLFLRISTSSSMESSFVEYNTYSRERWRGQAPMHLPITMPDWLIRL